MNVSGSGPVRSPTSSVSIASMSASVRWKSKMPRFSSIRDCVTDFGFDRPRAEQLMLAVHHEGHAVVAEGAREQMELHVQAMHDYGLWATIRQAPR